MSNLSLIKSENFGAVKCDFYRDEKKEVWMTREQVGMALEYANPRDAIAKIHRRNKERLNQFSGVVNLSTPSGVQKTTIYSTRGVYEICRWSQQPKANAFYDWVYEVLESLRKGDTVLIEKTKLKQLEIDARLRNARARQGKQLTTIAEKFKDILSPVAIEALAGEAAAITCGYPVLPKPKYEKTYTATEIGKMVGMSANMVGRIAIANNLKTDEHGSYILDKSPHSDKMVSTFVYSEKGKDTLIEVCKEIKEVQK